MISIKINTQDISTQNLIKNIYERLDYTLTYENRVKTIEEINSEYGSLLLKYYTHYKASNLKNYNNRVVYDKICNVYDKMSEYILLSDYELDDIVKDKEGLTAKDRKHEYPFSQESNLKTMQSKREVGLDTFLHAMENEEGMTKKKYDDQNHATYTLKDFEDKVNECPYIKTYMEFDKNVRKIIETLDKQVEEFEKLGIPFKCIDELTYTDPSGHTYKYKPEHLTAIKRGTGYTKNNSKEIDQDIIAIYREWFKPIYFNSVVRNAEIGRKMNLDFMDREHMAGLIKASCLTGQFGRFDEYVKKLDKLVKQTNLTDLEKQVYYILRKGKGLNLDKVKYEDNVNTISECARILKRSQSKVDEAFNSLVDKIMDKHEEQYEDYYFTFIARGTYKTCSKCGEVKLANERYFTPSAGRKDGFFPYCKECMRKMKQNS